MTWTRQRTYAALLALGACILLFRVGSMLMDGSATVLTWWVFGLLLAEGVIDGATLWGAIRWFSSGDESDETMALRAGAAAALLHAFRVLVFVMGRIGPWIDLDVLPEHRALHSARWSWGEVYVAAVLSVLGVLGVLIIWALRRRKGAERRHPDG